MSAVRFELCDPEERPASELLAAMRAELDDAYETPSRLDNPVLSPAELRPPGGAYLVGYEGTEAVAGGGLRGLSEGVAEIKRMYVRPAASCGVAAALLAALEDAARARGVPSGPTRHGAQAGARGAPVSRAGYEDVPPYNDNPFACFWAEKRLAASSGC